MLEPVARQKLSELVRRPGDQDELYKEGLIHLAPQWRDLAFEASGENLTVDFCATIRRAVGG